MKKILYFGLSCAVMSLLLLSCSRIDEPTDDKFVIVGGEEIPTAAYIQGKVRVVVTEDFYSSIESQMDESGVVDYSMVKSLQAPIAELGITRLERVFPPAGKFEARTREAGLHLILEVTYNEDVALTKADKNLSSVEGIVMVEYRPKIQLFKGEPKEVFTRADFTDSPETFADEFPFNDPKLKDQWHYYNDGKGSYKEAGCDINVFPVWEVGAVGNEEVIVSVVDGGIDYNHEDLNYNMWRNPEQSGDNVYGYNYVDGSFTIIPHDHGTHVAGTISAVNNNGKGVCGVAGGDYENNIKGVSLMSCQIFKTNPSDPRKDIGGNTSAAIKWGADHGAVISQNSWGYEYGKVNDTPYSEKQAIDYFVKNAGYDENRNQVGPMAGGVVIFAAGNDNAEESYPGSYKSAICVTSLGADFKRASYSNYGSFADIAAPGGEASKGRLVWSTIPGNDYVGYQGTSMACPHVSGVAALVVSQLGGPGFTADKLKEILLGSINDVDIYDYNSPYVGKLGAGLIDATKAVLSQGGNPPEKISDFKAQPRSNFVDFDLTIPADDTGSPTIIRVYYSTSQITSDNLSSCQHQDFKIEGYKAGDRYTGAVSDLEFSTNYYVAATALDFARMESELSEIINLTTGENHAPVFVLSSLEEVFNESDYKTIYIEVSDPDGHDFTVTTDESLSGLTIIQNKPDSVSVIVNAKDLGVGSHNFNFVAEDTYGMKSSLPAKFEVKGNNPPVVTKSFPDLQFASADDPAQTLDLNEYFSDPDGETLTFTAKASVNGIVRATLNESTLKILPLNNGSVDIVVNAFDMMGTSATQTVKVVVSSNQEVTMTIYPNPVIDFVNVRTSSTANNATISIFNTLGAQVYSTQANIGPFDPCKIDMSSCEGGMYNVVVTFTNSEGKNIQINSNFVKL